MRDAFGNPIGLGDYIAVAELHDVPLGPTLSNTAPEAVLVVREVTYISTTGAPYYESGGRLRAAKEPIYRVRT